MKIILEPHNPNWKIDFTIEKEKIFQILSFLQLEIEHIGSTAIKGLDAKPVIDIMIGLNNFKDAHLTINKISLLGYTYLDQFEDKMPFRKFFIKEKNHLRTHHIHMVQKDSEFWIRHIAFRDFLKQNPSAKKEYQELKRNLSLKEWNDGNEYAMAKTDFIREIEKRALK